jgi:hypothetical protein
MFDIAITEFGKKSAINALSIHNLAQSKCSEKKEILFFGFIGFYGLVDIYARASPPLALPP